MSGLLSQKRAHVVTIAEWESNFKAIAALALEPIYTSRSESVAAVFTGMCDDTSCDHPVMALIIATQTSTPKDLLERVAARIAELVPESCRVDLFVIALAELVERFGKKALEGVEILPALERRVRC